VNRTKDREAQGTFCPGPGILHEVSEGPRKKNRKRKKERKVHHGLAFTLCGPKSGR